MRGDIYHDIRKLCNDVFCRKETLRFEFLVRCLSNFLRIQFLSAYGTATVNPYTALED